MKKFFKKVMRWIKCYYLQDHEFIHWYSTGRIALSWTVICGGSIEAGAPVSRVENVRMGEQITLRCKYCPQLSWKRTYEDT